MTRLSAILLAQALVVGGPLHSPAWVMRSVPPSADELACTAYSSVFWSTSVKDGVPHAIRVGVREHVDPLPFQIAVGRDRNGSRWAAPVSDGWVVGFDNGEFGGGLWWFSHNGTESRRLRPGVTAPVNPDDAFQAENVLGLPVVGGERLVLMGLDHLIGRSGRIFRLVRDSAGWSLAPVAVVDAEPDPWFVDGDRLLFLTDSGLWSTEPRGSTRRIYETDIGRFSASALVRAPDGGLYIGLRHYVVKLEQANGKWRETWFTPAACRKVELRRAECVCVA